MTFAQFNLSSKILHLRMDTWAMLPETIGDRPWRVLWILHGGGSDHTDWMLHTKVASYVEKTPDLALIAVNSNDSCYVNEAHGRRYLDYVGDEHVKIMRNLFPQLSTDRADNWISGFSNGGYGAFEVGLSFPETFGVIGAYAAGDKADADFSNRMEEKIRLFGEGDMKESEYCIRKKLRELPLSGRPLPVIDHGVGSEDPWLDMNHLVRDEITAIPEDPYHYRYTEVPGIAHSHEAMDILIKGFIERMKAERP